jgi:hypothetical protein
MIGYDVEKQYQIFDEIYTSNPTISPKDLMIHLLTIDNAQKK